MKNLIKSPPVGSPKIVSPKIDFKGNIFHFVLAKHNQYAENKNRPEYRWATTRETFFLWLEFQWTINGKSFKSEDLVKSLDAGISEGFIDIKDVKKIPK